MDINLPTEYSEYNKVELCSNTLQKVKYFFGINDFPPIIIGKGENEPICWMYVQNNGIWNEIIKANKSYNLNLQVFAHKSKLLIQFINTIILDSYEKEGNILVIQKIDLTPLGFNIEGDLDGLRVGENSINNNKISGAKYFIGLG